MYLLMSRLSRELTRTAAQMGSRRDRRDLQGQRLYPTDGVPGSVQRYPQVHPHPALFPLILTDRPRRKVEAELFPCLRNYGISFYAYNPRQYSSLSYPFRILLTWPRFYFIEVGGGFFTGRYRSLQDNVEAGSRFDPNKNQGKVRL